MRIDYVLVPAAFVPLLPKRDKESAGWPESEMNGKRVRPTLGQVREACTTQGQPVTLFVTIKSLTPTL